MAAPREESRGGRGGRRNGRPHVDTTETPHYVTDEIVLHHIMTRSHI